MKLPTVHRNSSGLRFFKKNQGAKGLSFLSILEGTRVLDNQRCRPKTVTKGGLCCRKCVEHAFNHAHFCVYDNNMLVKPVYVKVLKHS